ncbi:peroxidase [Populus alba x Populus x berolinensis]|nr:peroxidase [Populus alba x Populus x berolinensis]
MSAQETVLGQESSRAVLARVTRSKASPGKERLMSASRSAELKGVEEMRMEASQPLGKQSWKKRRRVPAAVLGLVICLLVTVS